ncbi:hypothetical protein ASPZODRAFT_129044 [Penicilliopsis zonata CBS 506.65]|uniref:Rhodopsin domain-containing protein n=1 Tax=Penicilliopsis zonata CBS 506.65 TaxID=1073090 RepID=A0A1L9STK5_9EURO|nr:hypothetical protein ASPZODRAFT_129044 [Penicilliopsis zonata CBS 506.65]OJJ50417.1 hypothetical protein ASPZODRAFT_129044 [Penicilliopsis zonata CBS 506.65]
MTTAYDAYDIGSGLLATIWTLTTLSIVTMALRIYAKIKINKFSADDIIMLGSLALLIAGSGIANVSVAYGLGHHYSSLAHAREVKAVLYYCVTQTLGISACTVGRIAFIVYLVRLFPSSSPVRLVFWLLVVAQGVINVVSILLLFLQCGADVAPVFDYTLPETNCMALSVQINYGYFQGAFNSATDLFLAVFPTYTFWGLQLRFRIKVALVCLLGLGIFAMVASIVKTVELSTIANTTDPTVDQVTLLRWVYIESAIVIITSSIPCLRPLFVAMSKNFSSSPKHTYELTNRYGNASSGLASHSRNKYSRQTSQMHDEDESTRQILGDAQWGITKQIDVTIRNE